MRWQTKNASQKALSTDACSEKSFLFSIAVLSQQKLAAMLFNEGDLLKTMTGAFMVDVCLFCFRNVDLLFSEETRAAAVV